MKAVVLEAIGGPEELVLRDLPAADAEEGQTIVDVKRHSGAPVGA